MYLKLNINKIRTKIEVARNKEQFSWKNIPLLVFSMFMYELFLSFFKKKKRKFYLKSYFDIWLRNSDLHWLACSQVVRYLSLENTCSKSKKYTLTLGLSLRKSVRIRSHSGPHFPAFELNTERYSVSLHIQSECRKIRTRITPNTDTFYAVYLLFIWESYLM